MQSVTDTTYTGIMGKMSAMTQSPAFVPPSAEMSAAWYMRRVNLVSRAMLWCDVWVGHSLPEVLACFDSRVYVVPFFGIIRSSGE